MSKAWKPLLTVVLLLAIASPAAAETVTLTEDGFEPSNAIVEAGETVHFESETGAKWSVVADGGLFDSGELAPAGGFSVAPSVPGTHVYRRAPPAAMPSPTRRATARPAPPRHTRR